MIQSHICTDVANLDLGLGVADALLLEGILDDLRFVRGFQAFGLDLNWMVENGENETQIRAKKTKMSANSYSA